ncbi:hypothetical protein AAKU67_002071 [Oxalobacteraceae bacterium GrIS 2.11]
MAFNQSEPGKAFPDLRLRHERKNSCLRYCHPALAIECVLAFLSYSRILRDPGSGCLLKPNRDSLPHPHLQLFVSRQILLSDGKP